MLQHEREQRIQLEEMVGQLAREQSALEQVSQPSESTTNIPGYTCLCVLFLTIGFREQPPIFLNQPPHCLFGIFT